MNECAVEEPNLVEIAIPAIMPDLVDEEGMEEFKNSRRDGGAEQLTNSRKTKTVH